MSCCSAITTPGHMPMSELEELKRRSAQRAAAYVQDHMVLGLGTGSTVRWLIEELGRHTDKQHLQVVSSSLASKLLAQQAGLCVVEPDVIDHIDLVIDGVDQIDSRKQAIKGGGGALVREKILAEAAEQVIWIMDAGKRVETIEDYALPIELVPFSHPYVRRTLTNRGYDAILRMQQDSAFITDNGNLILDVRIPASRSIQEAHDELVHIAGVVETGYFHMEAMCITAETTGVTIW